MAIVRRERGNGSVTFYVTFTWQGRTVWERSGTNEREAKSLESKRKREVKAGSYSPEAPRGSRLTVSGWFRYFFTRRTNRSLDNDIALLENHVFCRDWFANARVTELEPRHFGRLVEELGTVESIGGKTVALIMGVVRQAFERAVFEGVIAVNPMKLPRGMIKWKSRKKRKPYGREDVRRLTTDERLPPDARMFNALAFYTGMREGEVCGRRFRDWDRDAEPLTALSVHTQYEDQPLKTDKEEDVRPRSVPVHPELEAMLRAWWSEGFELVYGRRPTADDFIVPHRKIGCHSKSSGYHAWRRSLAKLEIENRSLHSTRNTFISIARSNGAPKDVIESVTHNAKGDVVDDYTSWEWLTLCKAVAVFDVSVDANRTEAFLQLQSLDSNQAHHQGRRWKREDIEGIPALASGGKTGAAVSWGAIFDARQRKLLAADAANPGSVKAELALVRGLAKVRAGESADGELEEACEALGGGR